MYLSCFTDIWKQLSYQSETSEYFDAYCSSKIAKATCCSRVTSLWQSFPGPCGGAEHGSLIAEFVTALLPQWGFSRCLLMSRLNEVLMSLWILPAGPTITKLFPLNSSLLPPAPRSGLRDFLIFYNCCFFFFVWHLLNWLINLYYA